MIDTIYEIYVMGVFHEAWEDYIDAFNRANVLEEEFGMGHVNVQTKHIIVEEKSYDY